jgi:hypothetical protein
LSGAHSAAGLAAPPPGGSGKKNAGQFLVEIIPTPGQFAEEIETDSSKVKNPYSPASGSNVKLLHGWRKRVGFSRSANRLTLKRRLQNDLLSTH